MGSKIPRGVVQEAPLRSIGTTPTSSSSHNLQRFRASPIAGEESARPSPGEALEPRSVNTLAHEGLDSERDFPRTALPLRGRVAPASAGAGEGQSDAGPESALQNGSGISGSGVPSRLSARSLRSPPPPRRGEGSGAAASHRGLLCRVPSAARDDDEGSQLTRLAQAGSKIRLRPCAEVEPVGAATAVDASGRAISIDTASRTDQVDDRINRLLMRRTGPRASIRLRYREPDAA